METEWTGGEGEVRWGPLCFCSDTHSNGTISSAAIQAKPITCLSNGPLNPKLAAIRSAWSSRTPSNISMTSWGKRWEREGKTSAIIWHKEDVRIKIKRAAIKRWHAANLKREKDESWRTMAYNGFPIIKPSLKDHSYTEIDTQKKDNA